MKIQVVNKYKDDCTDAIYIGRGSPLGNPFPITKELPRLEAIAKYNVWIEQKLMDEDITVLTELLRLADLAKEKDIKLQCFCKPHPCHGDTIKDLVLDLMEDPKLHAYIKGVVDGE